MASFNLRHDRQGGYLGGFVLAIVAIGIQEGFALIEPSNVCQDDLTTETLFASGSFHSCAASGMTLNSLQTVKDYKRKVVCWGWADFGQCNPPEIDHVTSVAAGARHSCATDRQRLATCWGSDLYGQISLPRSVPANTWNKRYCRIGDYVDDTGSKYYGMCEDNGLVEYKLEDAFQQPECLVPNNRLGVMIGHTRWNRTTDAREKPVYRFDGKFVCSVVAMAAGGHHTCLIYGNKICTNCNTGYMECFGWNDYNQSQVPQCFDGGQPSLGKMYPDPTEMPLCQWNRPTLMWKEVSAGLFHTCGITTWSELLCWGDNRSGQLANMVAGDYNFPTQVKFTKVCAGAYHSCGIIETFPNTGQVDCWGNNEYGQAKDWADLLEEGLIEENGKFIHISCGASHTCGTFQKEGNTYFGKQASNDEGQKIICWGADFAGQSSVPTNLANGIGNKHIVAVSVGWEHSCAASLEGNQVFCWGGKKTKPGLTQGSLIEQSCVAMCTGCADGSFASVIHPFYFVILVCSFLSLMFGLGRG